MEFLAVVPPLNRSEEFSGSLARRSSELCMQDWFGDVRSHDNDINTVAWINLAFQKTQAVHEHGSVHCACTVRVTSVPEHSKLNLRQR